MKWTATSHQILLVTLLLFTIHCCNSIESDLTIDVEAGTRECFYQHVQQGSNFEVEYQVIEGGDLDVNFYINAPSGRLLLNEQRKTDGIHKLDAQETGDFGFCLDNTFSHYSNKLVFIEVMTDDPDPNWRKLEELQGLAEENEEGYFTMKLDDVKHMMDRIKEHLDRSSQVQNVLRVYEARDRAIQEDNFTRVNTWSTIQLFVMVAVGLTQVILIRSLFEDRSKIGKILKMKT